MNKNEIVLEVSMKSGVSIDDCKKVVDAFDEVLSEELRQSKGLKIAFDKAYQLLCFLKR